MRFIHTADLHLGAVPRLTIKQKKQVLEEQTQHIQFLFDYADRVAAEAIVIAGDLFHSKTVPYTIMQFFFSRVNDFGRPVIYAKGNHDEEFDAGNLPENFIVLDGAVKFGDVIFSTKETLLDKDCKNVLIKHGDIYTKGNDYIDLKKLKNCDIDYLALGHLHTFATEDFARGKLAYPGCLFGSGFDECGQKGFLDVDLGEEVKVEFVSLPARLFVIREIDITGLEKFSQIAKRAEEELQNENRDNYVRLEIKGYFDENAEKYLHLLQNKFSDFFYFEIRDLSKLKIDFEKLKGEELSFKAELLRLIEEQADPEDKDKISLIAIEALRGEDLSL